MVQSGGEAVLVACEASRLALASPLLAVSTCDLHILSNNIQQNFLNFNRGSGMGQIFPCFFNQEA